MAFLTVNGCRHFYRHEGFAGRPRLVLVHSLGADHAMWDQQMPAWLHQFEILRYDSRGHGATETTPGDYSIEQLAGDLRALTAAVGFGRFHLCGLSLGGMIGMAVAARAPECVDRLVLANTTAKHHADWRTRVEVVRTSGITAIYQGAIDRFFLPTTLAVNPHAASLARALAATCPEGYASAAAAIRDMDQRTILPRIAAPTLIITGSRDTSTPWEANGDVLAREIPNTLHVPLEAAHMSNYDTPEEFARTVANFLRAVR